MVGDAGCRVCDFHRRRKAVELLSRSFQSGIRATSDSGDGSFPEELRRTKPYNYTLFNMTGLATICQILSNSQDNLFTFVLPDGRGLRKAMDYMFPYIKNKASWPNKPDVEYFQYWPIRQPSLLFAGLAFSNPEYIKVWQTLPPEPEVEEIVRNNPIRQPLLWVKQ